MAALQQGRFEEAEASYREALQIFLDIRDRHRTAITYQQLGMAAQEQGRFEEAEASYREAPRSSWTSTTGTARPVPIISSERSRRISGGSRRPRPATERPSRSSLSRISKVHHLLLRSSAWFSPSWVDTSSQRGPCWMPHSAGIG